MWVIKLGGSLVGSAELSLWLDVLAGAASSDRIIVVTGGGPFADVVRETQSTLAIDDSTAHTMALQGMRQFALAVAARLGFPATKRLVTSMEIESNTATNGLTIWDPLDQSFYNRHMLRDWRTTSDSLSLCLAGAHRAGLVLVKSREPREPNASSRRLAAEGFVDESFPLLQRDATTPVWWLDKTQSRRMPEILAGRADLEQRIFAERDSSA